MDITDALILTWKEEENLKKLLFNCKHKTYKDKKIICNETGKVFKNRAEVARHLKCELSNVSHYFNGLQKSVKGFTFIEVKKGA